MSISDGIQIATIAQVGEATIALPAQSSLCNDGKEVGAK